MPAGIPVIYYGTEQGFKDPQLHPPRADPREPLWHSGYSHDHPLWLFLRISIWYRKAGRIWDTGIAQQVFVDNTTLVLERGDFVLVLNSVDEWESERRIKRNGPFGVQTLQGPLPDRFKGKTLTSIYNIQVCFCGYAATIFEYAATAHAC